jgi:nucleotide-binding universal stress UspA family protein
MNGFVLCCVDGENFNEAVCDYGVFVSNSTNSPLRFLNIVEHSSNTKELDLSGNISLGAKDDLLEKLSSEEEKSSKITIKKSRELLKNLEEKAKKTIQTDVSVSLIHGEVVPSLIELKNDIKIAILGIHSHSKTKIGENIQEVIREIHKPVLLINQKFIQPKKILIAYNGSNESKEVLKIVASNPLFGEVQRTIINSHKDLTVSQKLLEEAKEIFTSQNISVETHSLQTDKKEIITYCNENNFDILVMGAYGHSRFKDFIFGSFTSFVLENFNKPILLFK